eukprot:4017346-Pleurochrysis_carterae.AAC.1
MTDLNLSREQFDVLRHLLSFTYHPPADGDGDAKGDCYERLTAWENPFNSRHTIQFPQLQPRAVREAERELLFGICEAEQ